MAQWVEALSTNPGSIPETHGVKSRVDSHTLSSDTQVHTITFWHIDAGREGAKDKDGEERQSQTISLTLNYPT